MLHPAMRSKIVSPMAIRMLAKNARQPRPMIIGRVVAGSLISCKWGIGGSRLPGSRCALSSRRLPGRQLRALQAPAYLSMGTWTVDSSAPLAPQLQLQGYVDLMMPADFFDGHVGEQDEFI